MSVRALGLVVVAGLVIGALFPGTDAAAPPSLPAGEPAARPLKTSKNDARRHRTADVVLKRRYNGHFFADVQVNGTTIEFMVDTGASGIALTRRDAETLGLWWTESELETVGRGVSGAVTGKMVRLESVELGNREVRDLEAAIIPDGLEVSLLGQNFLRQVGEVKISGDEMVLR